MEAREVCFGHLPYTSHIHPVIHPIWYDEEIISHILFGLALALEDGEGVEGEGLHKIEVRYFDSNGGMLRLWVFDPNGQKMDPASIYLRDYSFS